MTSIPSLNVTPRTSFGNWLVPSRRRQLFCAASSSLKTIASAVLLDRQPFDRIVRWRTVAKVLSMGLVVRKCFQCSHSPSRCQLRQLRSLQVACAAVPRIEHRRSWVCSYPCAKIEPILTWQSACRGSRWSALTAGALRTESQQDRSGENPVVPGVKPSEMESGGGSDEDHTQCAVHPEMQPVTDDPDEPRRVVPESRQQQCRDADHHRKPQRDRTALA